MPAGHARRSGSGCSLHPDDQKSARTAAVVEGNILNIRDATGIAEKVQHVGFAIEVSHNARLAGRKLIPELGYPIGDLRDAGHYQCGRRTDHGGYLKRLPLCLALLPMDSHVAPWGNASAALGRTQIDAIVGPHIDVY